MTQYKTMDCLVDLFNNEKDIDAKLEIALEYNQLLLKSITYSEYYLLGGVPEYEEFVNIVGFGGLYQISNYGRIKSIRRFLIKKRARSTKIMAVLCVEEIKKIGCNKMGYLRVNFLDNNRASYFNIHRLVALHFIPNPNKYPQILHLDNKPGNPHFKNLKWGTQKQNIQQSVQEGRWHTGSKNNKAKLIESDILKIREFIKNGQSSHAIGKLFGVSHSQILSIKHNRTWSQVK